MSLTERAWRFFKRYARRYAAEVVSAVLAAGIVVAGVIWYGRLPASATIEDRVLLVQCIVFALGLVSVVLLVLELRQKASWNRVLSYHDYFGELPAREKVRELYECLDRLGIQPPSNGQPLTKEQATAILADKGVRAANDLVSRPGGRVVREYLNDFEEFCGAISAGVVSESYVRELEGSRTINAYYGFEELIRQIRAGEVKSRHIGGDQRVSEQNLRPLHKKPYHELWKVAATWKRRREREYQKLLKKRAKNRRRQEQEEQDDGVPPESA
ncbi:MAG TPA: hypothetical protein VGR92_03575 [Steroidobacteraceae bacterium]|nr:hypothetical protein [Steroidobacteraceae bacterium]